MHGQVHGGLCHGIGQYKHLRATAWGQGLVLRKRQLQHRHLLRGQPGVHGLDLQGAVHRHTKVVARVHRGRTLIVIAHDLADMAAYDRVLVLKGGRVVEHGLTDRVLDDPQHPYTQLLVASVLQA